MDKGTNKYGQNLLELCKTVPLRICNGRKLGDILGSFTCYKWNGQSAVDYCAASPSLMDKIAQFKVHSFLPTLSDHLLFKLFIHLSVIYISFITDFSFCCSFLVRFIIASFPFLKEFVTLHKLLPQKNKDY